MSAKKTNKRSAPRKNVHQLEIKNLTAVEPFCLIARKATLVDASTVGLLIRIHRKDLVPKLLRQHLTISSVEGSHVLFNIKDMNLDMDGTIARTKYIGNSTFEIAVRFSLDAPEYWRESLVDLLPSPGEIDDH